MAKSKQSDDTLKLGKLLVKELKLEQSADTLSRWMAHHISELMTEAKKTQRRKKQEAEDRCREAILALWKHVSFFQRSHRPLADVDVIFATVRALDPDNTAYFYHSDARENIEKSELPNDVKEWLTLSQGIDYSARILIEMCLGYAAKTVKDENEEWVQLAKSLDADIPQTLMIRILTHEEELSEADIEAKRVSERIENLKNRKDRLQLLLKLSNHLSSSIDEEMAQLEKAHRS